MVSPTVPMGVVVTDSPCGLYRFSKKLLWRNDGLTLHVILNHPPLHDVRDTEFDKCLAIAKNRGFCGLVVTYVYPNRAKDQDELHNIKLKKSHLTDMWIGAMSAPSNHITVHAWAKRTGMMVDRSHDIEDMVKSLTTPHCFAVSSNGLPFAPIMVLESSEIVKFPPPHDLPRKQRTTNT